jgi:hypothetical protein
MELELKHIAPYLPYGVYAEDVNTKEVRQVSLLHFTYNKQTVGINHLLSYGMLLQKHILRLRPISYLTKEIDHNGERFVPIVELLKIRHKTWYEGHLESRYSEIEFESVPNFAKAWFKFQALNSIRVWHIAIHEEPYWVIEKLLEWQFDLFGLISNGLAVAIDEEGKAEHS